MSAVSAWWRAHHRAVLAGLGLVALQGTALAFMGHPATCTCGTIKLWQGVVASPENSQQLTDWYTFSHIIHGFLFYLLLRVLFPKMPAATRFILALGIEVSWEIIENTPMVINHYRAQALAQGYAGDSIVNSLSDSFAMMLGFFIAYKTRVWLVVALALALELLTLYFIRDGLALNVIQFIHPLPIIWQWQAGG